MTKVRSQRGAMATMLATPAKTFPNLYLPRDLTRAFGAKAAREHFEGMKKVIVRRSTQR